jgi:hypothetical protein
MLTELALTRDIKSIMSNYVLVKSSAKQEKGGFNGAFFETPLNRQKPPGEPQP